MHILFGPEHDALHIDPAEPCGYEWWYFDAISDDGNFVLVAIYFLGTPMSPYYKAAVDGRAPMPSAWCGVFFSLHERVDGKWREQAYAYNIYDRGSFGGDLASANIGASSMEMNRSDGRVCWNVDVEERALWRGSVSAQLTFEATETPNIYVGWGAETESVADHTWVCAAPQCRVLGDVTTAAGRKVTFSGDGYHDHNFGTLPYADTDIWYWGRATVHGNDGTNYLAIYYDNEYRKKPREVICLLFDSDGGLVTAGRAYGISAASVRNLYGLGYNPQLTLGVHGKWDFKDRFLQAKVRMRHESGMFSEGPFYRRLPFTVEISDARAGGEGAARWSAHGEGICEVFRPARLCGPIASRAMWSRMRRRRS